MSEDRTDSDRGVDRTPTTKPASTALLESKPIDFIRIGYPECLTPRQMAAMDDQDKYVRVPPFRK